jgi:hypothetical protein
MPSPNLTGATLARDNTPRFAHDVMPSLRDLWSDYETTTGIRSRSARLPSQVPPFYQRGAVWPPKREAPSHGVTGLLDGNVQARLLPGVSCRLRPFDDDHGDVTISFVRF